MRDMNKKIEKYKTKLLDEVAFLRMKGLDYKTLRIANKNAVWVFEKTKELERHKKMFWTGSPVISLHKWLTVRQQIKFEQVATEIQESKEFRDMERPIENGKLYYYINEHKKICKIPFGNHRMHQNNIKQGNFFLTEEEAKIKLNELQN